jgi:hypothetical protein
MTSITASIIAINAVSRLQKILERRRVRFFIRAVAGSKARLALLALNGALRFWFGGKKEVAMKVLAPESAPIVVQDLTGDGRADFPFPSRARV